MNRKRIFFRESVWPHKEGQYFIYKDCPEEVTNFLQLITGENTYYTKATLKKVADMFPEYEFKETYDDKIQKK